MEKAVNEVAEIDAKLKELDIKSENLERRLTESQKELDRARAGVKQVGDSLIEWAKVLVVLNSASIAVALGFVQALLGKGVVGDFRPYALTAIGCFIAGVVVSALTFAFRVHADLALFVKERFRNPMMGAVIAPAFSLLFFLIGSVNIVLGVAKVFK